MSQNALFNYCSDNSDSGRMEARSGMGIGASPPPPFPLATPFSPRAPPHLRCPLLYHLLLCLLRKTWTLCQSSITASLTSTPGTIAGRSLTPAVHITLAHSEGRQMEHFEYHWGMKKGELDLSTPLNHIERASPIHPRLRGTNAS